MRTISADLTKQSRVAEGAAWCLRDMSSGQPTPSDLRAVAAALELSGSKLRQMAIVIGNSKEGQR